MTKRTLVIGRWLAEFYFAEDGYDIDTLVDRLFDFGASAATMKKAIALMESGEMNTGFTFSNPYDRLAIVAVGPTTSGSEFANTLTHELYHLSTVIADGLGLDLMEEGPAYMIGDMTSEFISTICNLGCDKCNS